MASDEDVADALREQAENEDPIVVRWTRRLPSLSSAIDVLFSAGIVAYGLYLYATVDAGWARTLALLFAGIFALQGVLRLVRWAARLHTSEVARIEVETAAEQHPEGCMCPFCCKHRAEQGQEVNPHD